MSDETDFSPSPGDVVFDRDAATERQNPAVVVNCIPGATAEEWNVPGGHTVADDNPDYPSDASVIAVVYEQDIAEGTLEWNREKPIPFTELNDAGLHYYAFPVTRLIRDPDESSDDQPPTLTDIKHVGESRADDLRAAGYESVADVAKADQSGLADVDGIGEARAETLSASATDLLDEQPDGSEPPEPDETETDAGEGRETTESETAPSAAVVALSRYLDTDGDGMDAEIAADTQSVRVANADHSYRVSLDGVEGDGPHRPQLEEAVEKVRAATQTPNE